MAVISIYYNFLFFIIGNKKAIYINYKLVN